MQRVIRACILQDCVSKKVASLSAVPPRDLSFLPTPCLNQILKLIDQGLRCQGTHVFPPYTADTAVLS